MSVSGYLDLPRRTVGEAQRARFAVGDQVHHARWGDGEIVDIFLTFTPRGVSCELPRALVAFRGGDHHDVDLVDLVNPSLRVP